MNKNIFIIIAIAIVAVLIGFLIYRQNKIKNTCGIENCHGLEIQCGTKPAQVCSEIYESGDICRNYAECGKVNGICQQIINDNFTMCKNCAENCQNKYKNDPVKTMSCESNCE